MMHAQETPAAHSLFEPETRCEPDKSTAQLAADMSTAQLAADIATALSSCGFVVRGQILTARCAPVDDTGQVAVTLTYRVPAQDPRTVPVLVQVVLNGAGQ